MSESSSNFIGEILRQLNQYAGFIPQVGQMINDIKSAYGSDDYRALQGIFAGSAFNLTPDQEKWLDNMISNQNTNEARAYDTQMAETDLLRAGKQLQELGLSASGVLQTGGSASSGVGIASNSKSNIALERYQQRMNVARQLISMSSSMASAGIYGHALGAAKKASSVLASQASHSAYDVFDSGVEKKSPYSNLTRAEMLRMLNADLPSETTSDIPF